LSYRSTEHPSGREVDSGDGRKGRGRGVRSGEGGRRTEGDGERERSSTRARVRQRRGGDTNAAAMALDLGIAICKLRLRPTAVGGGLGLGQLGVGAGPRGIRGGGLYTRRRWGGGLTGLVGPTPYACRAACRPTGRTSGPGPACSIRSCRPGLLCFRARPCLGQAKTGRASCRPFSPTHLAIYRYRH
jgi:hypothetical protein